MDLPASSSAPSHREEQNFRVMEGVCGIEALMVLFVHHLALFKPSVGNGRFAWHGPMAGLTCIWPFTS